MAATFDQQRKFELVLEGARIRASGRPRDACPYPLNSQERAAWMEGFDGEPAEEGPDLPMDKG